MTVVEPLETQCEWHSGDVGEQFVFELTAAHVAELDAALEYAEARTDDVLDVTRELFPLPTLAPELTKLTEEGLLARAPVWSPDGEHIAYLANQSGYFEIFEIDVTTDPSGALIASRPRQLTKDLQVDAASGLSWGH